MDIKEVLPGVITGDEFPEMDFVKDCLIRMAEEHKVDQKAQTHEYYYLPFCGHSRYDILYNKIRPELRITNYELNPNNP